MINDLLAKLPGFKQDIIYKLISYQDLKLCLDVGAAAGVTTRWIKMAGSESTRVVAFEPFPGNHNYFLKNTEQLTNIELVKKAASSTTGVSSFRVLSTVQGGEKGWEKMSGYSSTGFLTSEKKTKPPPASAGFQEFTVDTVAIADLINSHVDFMKIDVQGGEFEVLKGCEPIMLNHGIDVMYVEFDGDRRIIELLNSLGYTIFDTDYLLIPKGDQRSLLDNIGFYDFKELNLSTGRKAYRAKLSLSNEEYCDFFDAFRAQCGQIYTDLICVSEPFLSSFIQNWSAFIADSSSAEKTGDRPLKSIPRPVGKHLPRPSAPTRSPAPISTAASSGGAEHPASSSLPPIPSKQSDSSPTPQRKRPPQAQPVQNQGKLNAVPAAEVFIPEAPESAGLVARYSALQSRVINYYSRWPVVLAGGAIAFNTLAIFETPLRWGFMCLGTSGLLFLIGHAASKADGVLTQIEQLKQDRITDG